MKITLKHWGLIVSGYSELHAEQQDDDSMMECCYAQEEQAFYDAVNQVKSFIESGAVTFEQVEKILRGKDNGNHS